MERGWRERDGEGESVGGRERERECVLNHDIHPL